MAKPPHINTIKGAETFRAADENLHADFETAPPDALSDHSAGLPGLPPAREVNMQEAIKFLEDFFSEVAAC